MAKRMRRAYLNQYTKPRLGRTKDTSHWKDLFVKKRQGTYIEYAIKLGLMPQDGGTTKAELMARAAKGEPLPKAIENAAKILDLESVKQFRDVITIFKRKSEQLNMFFGSKGGRCMFVKVSAYGTIIQASVVYSDRDKAMDRYKNNKILWLQTNIVAQQ